MPAVTASARSADHPSPSTTISRGLTMAQCDWIETRNKIGAILDGYLRMKPPAEMRVAVERLEVTLALRDHAAGLL
jgi:hypothetical protein